MKLNSTIRYFVSLFSFFCLFEWLTNPKIIRNILKAGLVIKLISKLMKMINHKNVCTDTAINSLSLQILTDVIKKMKNFCDKNKRYACLSLAVQQVNVDQLRLNLLSPASTHFLTHTKRESANACEWYASDLFDMRHANARLRLYEFQAG